MRALPFGERTVQLDGVTLSVTLICTGDNCQSRFANLLAKHALPTSQIDDMRVTRLPMQRPLYENLTDNRQHGDRGQRGDVESSQAATAESVAGPICGRCRRRHRRSAGGCLLAASGWLGHRDACRLVVRRWGVNANQSINGDAERTNTRSQTASGNSKNLGGLGLVAGRVL